jgi:hypothetical protein
MVIWRPELCNRKEYLMSTSVALQGPSFSHALSHCNANYHFRLLIFLKILSILARPLVEAQLTGLSIKISYRFWPAFIWHGTPVFSFLLSHQKYLKLVQMEMLVFTCFFLDGFSSLVQTFFPAFLSHSESGLFLKPK